MMNKLHVYDEETKENYYMTISELRLVALLKKISNFVKYNSILLEDNNLTYFQLGNFNAQLSYFLSLVGESEDRMHFTDFKNWEVLIKIYNNCFQTDHAYDYSGILTFREELKSIVDEYLEDKIVITKENK